MREFRWVGEQANKSLDAKNPSQALLNSMGVFVRVLLGEGDAALQAVGSQTVLLHLRRKVEDLEVLAGGSETGRWYRTTALLERSTARLETFPVPVEASGSPVTAVAKRKTFLWIFFLSLPMWMQSSPFPCPAVMVLEGL